MLLQKSIDRVDDIVEGLPQADWAVFDRIYRVSIALGQMRPPDSMVPWIEKRFGSVDEVTIQKIVKITNVVTWEGALFNRLRAKRPMMKRDVLAMESQIFNGDPLTDPFASPLRDTPADSFGRVEGRYCITASNIAKYDGYHGVAVFKEASPWRFGREQVVDYFETGFRWARKGIEEDPDARYFFFMWNCLWRAGATINHGHAQMSLSHDMHYARIEHLRQAALAYRARYGSSYFDDMYHIHETLGLGTRLNDVTIMAHLTPIKEKEILLMAPKPCQELWERTYDALACLRDHLGVLSFNLALYTPPLARTDEDWSDFPTIVRIVDRGDPTVQPSDIGAMELYAQPVISSDPFQVAATLLAALR
ncbi:MAG: hypothetical protein Q7T26_10270 [Dehalococcoidia bacterium]|nr:hypothetical protein [Dehalococcoidia bacterium]